MLPKPALHLASLALRTRQRPDVLLGHAPCATDRLSNTLAGCRRDPVILGMTAENRSAQRVLLIAGCKPEHPGRRSLVLPVIYPAMKRSPQAVAHLWRVPTVCDVDDLGQTCTSLESTFCGVKSPSCAICRNRRTTSAVSVSASITTLRPRFSASFIGGAGRRRSQLWAVHPTTHHDPSMR